MAKGKKKKGKKKQPAGDAAKKSSGGPKPRRRGEADEACPSCGEAAPLFWHGRRVLCEACVEDATHEAERGEITMGNLVKGAVALFRDVGWKVIALLLGYSVTSKLVLAAVTLDDASYLAASFAREIVGLIFVAAAFDLGLTRLDGEAPHFGRSLALGARKFLPLFLAQSLEGLIVLVHLFFLIVPGVVKALSYAIVTPLVVSGEAGAISCLHESWRRMHGHRRNVAPLMIALWLPFIAYQWVGAVLFTDPGALSDSPALMALDALFPLLDIPWLFVALTLHAKLRARYRLSADA